MASPLIRGNDLCRWSILGVHAQTTAEARARYAESLRQFAEANRFYEQILREADELRELVPDEMQRALITQRAIQDAAYWDAETSAAELR